MFSLHDTGIQRGTKRWILSVLCMVLIIPLTVWGEVKVGLELEYADVLQFERVTVHVWIHNVSLSKMTISSENEKGSKLMLMVEKEGRLIALTTDEIIKRDYIISPNETREIPVEFSSVCDITEMGRYLICAAIQIGDKMFMSKKKMLDVVNGIRLCSRRVPVKGVPDTMREYTLRYWPRKKETYLFLSVEEPDKSLNYGVFPLGPLLRVHEPLIEADDLGVVTIVHQSASDRYTRTVFRSDHDKVHFVDQSHYSDMDVKSRLK